MRSFPASNPLWLIEGGIGDALQFAPFILANKSNKLRYMALVHYKGAKEFLRSIGAVTEKCETYTNEKEKEDLFFGFKLNEVPAQVPRTQYFTENPFPKQKPLFSNGKPVVGVHLCGSKFSTNHYIKHGEITKSIPADIITELGDYNVIVFGLPEEITKLNIKPSSNLQPVSYLDIAKSLSYVEQCDAVIAADSSIKTMSSMLKIPTFIWIPDQMDFFRDITFINPYVDDGVMQVFKYKDSFKQLKEGMDKTKQFLQELFQ
jgi:ADP-heptose:LPS heptosyltransferase